MARSRIPPNVLFVMADDHAVSAISGYGSVLTTTPAIDRLADEGMRFDACFCGRSVLPLLRGNQPADWRTSMYYRYWMHLDPSHHVQAHFGVRTAQFKLIRYPGHGDDVPGASAERRSPAWELFDLERDPNVGRDVHADPTSGAVVEDLTGELARLQDEVGDTTPTAEVSG